MARSGAVRGGLHVCARPSPATPADLEKTIERARASGVAVENLAAYCGERPTQQGLVIGYGAIPAEHVGEGLKRLAAAFRETTPAA
jgi:GntR family transcriptional regulator/MocR family aminotransferase